jgi:hypothetical protein
VSALARRDKDIFTAKDAKGRKDIGRNCGDPFVFPFAPFASFAVQSFNL